VGAEPPERPRLPLSDTQAPAASEPARQDVLWRWAGRLTHPPFAGSRSCLTDPRNGRCWPRFRRYVERDLRRACVAAAHATWIPKEAETATASFSLQPRLRLDGSRLRATLAAQAHPRLPARQARAAERRRRRVLRLHRRDDRLRDDVLSRAHVRARGRSGRGSRADGSASWRRPVVDTGSSIRSR
jgi:hypothetical protein